MLPTIMEEPEIPTVAQKDAQEIKQRLLNMYISSLGDMGEDEKKAKVGCWIVHFDKDMEKKKQQLDSKGEEEEEKQDTECKKQQPDSKGEAKEEKQPTKEKEEEEKQPTEKKEEEEKQPAEKKNDDPQAKQPDNTAEEDMGEMSREKRSPERKNPVLRKTPV